MTLSYHAKSQRAAAYADPYAYRREVGPIEVEVKDITDEVKPDLPALPAPKDSDD